MEQRTNTSVAGSVGKKLLMAAILGAGLVLTGAVQQASAHPVNPPRTMAYHQPVVVVVKTPPRHHYRPHYPPPRHHSYYHYRGWR